MAVNIKTSEVGDQDLTSVCLNKQNKKNTTIVLLLI